MLRRAVRPPRQDEGLTLELQQNYEEPDREPLQEREGMVVVGEIVAMVEIAVVEAEDYMRIWIGC